MRQNPILLLALFLLPAAAVGAPAGPPSGGRSHTPASGPPLVLNWPLGCEIGRSCFIQNYVDDDPGPGASDYRCGPNTYDRHTGTDIRLPTLAAMRRGVGVRAAVAGVVVATRDGMVDLSIRDPANPQIKNQDCGNAVIVDEPGGWQTMYCHMRQGSVLVHRGDRVSTGQALGKVGLSGDTEFPHLHIEVRLNGRPVDPFAFGAAPRQCGGGRSLWAPAVAARVVYREPQVINLGFADAPASQEAIDAELVRAPSRSSSLVAYVRTIGLNRGDVQTLSMTGPDGRPLVSSAAPPLDHAKAVWTMSAGKKAPPGGWPAGHYRAVYTVRRGASVVLTRAWPVVIGVPAPDTKRAARAGPPKA